MKENLLRNLCSDTVGALCHRMSVKSQLVILLDQVDGDAFDDHADDGDGEGYASD